MDSEYLWQGGPRLKQRDGVFRLGTDSVLLAHFAAARRARCCADLGCGSGVLSVILASLDDSLRVDAVDINPVSVQLCRENAQLNSLEGRISARLADIEDYRAEFKAGEYDLVITNPPYFPEGSGKTARDSGIRAARSEGGCGLGDICAAAGYMLRWGGRLFIVQRPERLAELFRYMDHSGIEPKRLRLTAHAPGTDPASALVEGVRGAKPGLRVEPMLYLCDAEGRESAEAREIYRREESGA